VAVDSQQITAETANPASRKRPRGRPFRKGESGNPAGRPLGSRNRSTLAAQLLLDGEAAALTRKALDLALAGDPVALRLCLSRIVAPRRDRTVEFALPPIRDVADIAAAMTAVAVAAANGIVTPREGYELAQMVETVIRAIEAGDFERRLQRAEAANGVAP
jgi:hypothetical protein